MKEYLVIFASCDRYISSGDFEFYKVSNLQELKKLLLNDYEPDDIYFIYDVTNELNLRNCIFKKFIDKL